MKYMLIGLSFLILTFNAFALNGEQIFKKHSTSIIHLTVDSVNEKGEMERSTGTGFFIHESGLIFTNRHVIKGHTKISGNTANNNYEIIKMIAVHPFADVALLKVEKIKTGDTNLKISDSAAKIGEEVFLIGHPKGLNYSITRGIISYSGEFAIDEMDKELGNKLQHTAPTLPGSSGSPILNRDGEVIGIHFRGFFGRDGDLEFKIRLKQQGFNFGYHAEYLKEMLNGYNNIPVNKSVPSKIADSELSEIVNPETLKSVEPKNDLASLIRELKAYTPPSEVRLGSK